MDQKKINILTFGARWVRMTAAGFHGRQTGVDRKLVQAECASSGDQVFVYPRWFPRWAPRRTWPRTFGEFPAVRFSALFPNVKDNERADGVACPVSDTWSSFLSR